MDNGEFTMSSYAVLSGTINAKSIFFFYLFLRTVLVASTLQMDKLKICFVLEILIKSFVIFFFNYSFIDKNFISFGHIVLPKQVEGLF